MSGNRKVLEEVLSRSASDPAFRAALLDDPRKAMEEAGLIPDDELRLDCGGPGTCTKSCDNTCKSTCDGGNSCWVSI